MSEPKLRRRVERPIARGRRRAAFVPLFQLIGGTAACAMWVALALPGLHLLPGLGGNADANVSISLQSALLGIDDRGVTSNTTLSPSLVRSQQRSLRFASLHIPLDSRLSVLGTSLAANAVSAAAAPPAPPAPPSTPDSSSSAPGPSSTPAPPDVSVTSPPPATVTKSPTQQQQQHKTPPPPTLPVAPPPTPSVPAPVPQLLAQAIVFTSAPPADAVVGGSAYQITATATSGLPVVFSNDPSSTGICLVAGTSVLPIGAGTCTVDANQTGNAKYKPAPQVQQSFAIVVGLRTLSGQSISFVSAPPSTPVVGAGPYVLSAYASSGLPVRYSTAAGSTDVCQIVNGNIWFIGAGTCRIFADQDGDAIYSAAAEAQQVITVFLVPQTLTFTSTPPAGAVAGGLPYTISAHASSGLPVVFSADSSSAAVCTVVGAIVTPVGPGTCLIDANQFGNTSYAPIQAQQSFTIGAAAPSQSVQTIQFSSLPPVTGLVGGTPYAVSAAASSGLAVSFGSATPAVCTVSGATVSFGAAGTCTVTADQAGDASYFAAPQVQQSFTVTAVPQAVSFTSSPPGGALVGDPDYTVAATATSGLAVTFSSATPGICTVVGTTVSLVGAGTCTIDADQAGDGTYQSAAEVQQSFAITTPSLSVQSISYLSTAPTAATIGGTAYTVSASASSGLPVSFTIDAASAAVCTISGTTVSFSGTGTCTVDADQPGDASYLAAPRAQQSFTVGRGAQTISFTSAPPAGAVVGGSSTISATATSGLPVAFTSGSPLVCTVSGAAVSFVAAGTCTVDADQPGDATYAAAPPTQQSFSVAIPASSSQAIAFTSTAPSSAAIGDTYTVAANASSGLSVTLTIDAASASVCSISGATVTLNATGTCTVDANQAGNGSYSAAPQVQQSFSVGLTPQAISFSSAPPSGAIVGDPAYTVSATATSGLAVSFSADASSAGICTVSGSTVTLVGTGTCTVDADQPGNSTYGIAPQAQQTFGIGTPTAPSVQTITYTSSAPSGAVVGGAAYTVAASASSGLAVTFSSATPSVCTVSGTSVSPVGAGTCTINADQPGNASYQAAPQAQQSYSVSLRTQAISFTSSPPGGATVGGATYSVSATSSSGLAVAFSSATAGVCTISGTTVSFVAAGTCTIDADQAGDATYQPAAQAQQSFTVAAPSASSQSISFTSTPPAAPAIGGATYTVSAVASSGLAVSFSIDAASSGVCTITGSAVSFTGTGTCTIDANQSGNASYQAAPQVQQSFAVGLTNQTISFTSTPPGSATIGDSPYTVTATASSGLTVAFSLSAGSTGVCTRSGSTVSFTGAGTCTILANQAGNGTYAAAPQVQQSFSVSTPSKTPQTITFTSTAPSGAVVGTGSYIPTATASSGLAVTLAINAASSAVCTISSGTVTFTAAGTCQIDADQAGDGTYNPAPQAHQSFTVNLRPQTVHFFSTAPTGAVVGGSTYNAFAWSSSFLIPTLTIDPSSAAVCTISGWTVTNIGAGTCTIDANQAGNGTYAAAPQVQQSYAVGKGSQTITFTSTAPNNVNHNSGTYTVSATSGSGLPVAFSLDASSAGVCTLSGSTVTFVARGNCIIYANQAGDANWLPAPQDQQVIGVKN